MADHITKVIIVSILVAITLFILWKLNILETSLSPASITLHKNLKVRRTNGSLADDLRQKIKVLCWIMTSPKTINTKARTISLTWGPHCDVTLYISSAANDDPPATVVQVDEGRKKLTDKTKAAFKLIYEKYFDAADWFFKADDDTFLIVENLRYLLALYDPRLPIHFGHQFYSADMNEEFRRKESWLSGGAGYVLSREALRRLVTQGMTNNTETCPWKVSEDYYVSLCMENLGVVQGLAADVYGKPSFLPITPISIIKDDVTLPDWYRKYSVHYIRQGRLNCCSTYMVSFHYVDNDTMLLLYFLLYKVRVHGLSPPVPEDSLQDSAFRDPEIILRAKSIAELPIPRHLRATKTPSI